MPKPSSKLAGTVVLIVTLLSIQGALWYIRPIPAEKAPSLYRYTAVNIHGGSRKLLDVNFTTNSDQKASSAGDLMHPGTANDHQQVSYKLTLHISDQN